MRGCKRSLNAVRVLSKLLAHSKCIQQQVLEGKEVQLVSIRQQKLRNLDAGRRPDVGKTEWRKMLACSTLWPWTFKFEYF